MNIVISAASACSAMAPLYLCDIVNALFSRAGQNWAMISVNKNTWNINITIDIQHQMCMWILLVLVQNHICKLITAVLALFLIDFQYLNLNYCTRKMLRTNITNKQSLLPNKRLYVLCIQNVTAKSFHVGLPCWRNPPNFCFVSFFYSNIYMFWALVLQHKYSFQPPPLLNIPRNYVIRPTWTTWSISIVCSTYGL